MSIEEIMETLGLRKVTMLVKVDDERMAQGMRPWTVVLSGTLGEQVFARADSSSLGECFQEIIKDFNNRQGDWGWLTELFQRYLDASQVLD
ncbi:hypothetical protein GCM10020221_15530 [Streptomyces thioluteus]|uniref:Uncharacterized protein n=1 Tax=Streptomyces thioluteus TaxID=66431 RepID=A0ABN3WKP3_STRTU